MGERLGDAPPPYVTLGWLIGSLSHQAFGVVLLLLALLGLLPGVSLVAGLLVVMRYRPAEGRLMDENDPDERQRANIAVLAVVAIIVVLAVVILRFLADSLNTERCIEERRHGCGEQGDAN